MPDAPDWFQYRRGSERHVVGDLSELAARLGSPVAYDRRGDVLWYDFFEYEINNWGTTLGEGTDTVTAVTTYPYIGKYAARLTTTGGGLRMAAINAYFQPPVANKWGLEIALWLHDDYDFFYVEFSRYAKTFRDRPRLRLNGADQTIELYNSDGDWVVVGTIPNFTWSYGNYHHLKLVCDFENSNYQRILWDSQSIDVSDYELHRTALVTEFQNYISLGFAGQAGGTDYCQIAFVIVTAYEP